MMKMKKGKVLIDLRPRRINPDKLRQISSHYPSEQVWAIVTRIQWDLIQKHDWPAPGLIFQILKG